MEIKYNPSDKSTIIEFAQKLLGKSLREVCDPEVINHVYSGKGNFGQVLEKYYFGYEPNSVAEADFSKIGMELKSSPLKKLKNEEYRAKERLVLNIINYLNVINQDFESSDFYKKNSSLLLIFYLHEASVNILDFIVKLVAEWKFSSTDLEIIKQDWETINKKILAGKAHELSEGDTYYLGACTKGSSSNTVRRQPFSKIPAKQRAYSFKQGYVNHIIASIASESSEKYGKLLSTPEVAEKLSIEKIVTSKFLPYYGKTINEILYKNNVSINVKAKNFYALLTKSILGIELNKEIEEFEKAEIIIKSVRLKENNLPKEDISFPNFRFDEIIHQEWEETDIKEILEHKFLFVFYQFEGQNLVLRKVKFWNMPYSDLLEVEKVWNYTKEIILNGNIVRILKNGVRYTNFPNKSFSSIAHVRPHASNSEDTYPLPFKDRYTGATEYTKHCFWFNKSYIKDEIYLK